MMMFSDIKGLKIMKNARMRPGTMKVKEQTS